MWRETVTALVIVGLLTVPLSADQIIAKGNYEVPVDKVTGFSEGMIVYVSTSGQEKQKALRDIQLITVNSQDAFNRAEQLRREDNREDAVTSYDVVIGAAGPDWLVQISRYRTVELAAKDRNVDVAVSTWLDILASDSSEAAISLLSVDLPAKGDERTARAIRILEARLSKLQNEVSRQRTTAVLAGFYRHEGQEHKADSLAVLPTEQVAVHTDNGGTGVPISQRRRPAAETQPRHTATPQELCALRRRVEDLPARIDAYQGLYDSLTAAAKRLSTGSSNASRKRLALVNQAMASLSTMMGPLPRQLADVQSQLARVTPDELTAREVRDIAVAAKGSDGERLRGSCSVQSILVRVQRIVVSANQPLPKCDASMVTATVSLDGGRLALQKRSANTSEVVTSVVDYVTLANPLDVPLCNVTLVSSPQVIPTIPSVMPTEITVRPITLQQNLDPRKILTIRLTGQEQSPFYYVLCSITTNQYLWVPLPLGQALPSTVLPSYSIGADLANAIIDIPDAARRAAKAREQEAAASAQRYREAQRQRLSGNAQRPLGSSAGTLVTCPRCNGTGSSGQTVISGRASKLLGGTTAIPCQQCNGLGVIQSSR